MHRDRVTYRRFAAKLRPAFGTFTNSGRNTLPLPAERIEVGVEPNLAAALCPTCQRVSSQIHDTAEPQTLRDLVIWGRCALRRFIYATCHSALIERIAWREPRLCIHAAVRPAHL